VIDAEARRRLERTSRACARLRGTACRSRPARGRRARHLRRADADRDRALARLEREVFGPVLHVLRYAAPSSAC
jgi:delta 1-pyrroline-5-carboxylate dehydrogenase